LNDMKKNNKLSTAFNKNESRSFVPSLRNEAEAGEMSSFCFLFLLVSRKGYEKTVSNMLIISI